MSEAASLAGAYTVEANETDKATHSLIKTFHFS